MKKAFSNTKWVNFGKNCELWMIRHLRLTFKGNICYWLNWQLRSQNAEPASLNSRFLLQVHSLVPSCHEFFYIFSSLSCASMYHLKDRAFTHLWWSTGGRKKSNIWGSRLGYKNHRKTLFCSKNGKSPGPTGINATQQYFCTKHCNKKLQSQQFFLINDDNY